MKFKVLAKDCLAVPEQAFDLFDIEAEDQEHAWDIIAEEITTNYSREWLLNEKEFTALQKCIALQSEFKTA